MELMEWWEHGFGFIWLITTFFFMVLLLCMRGIFGTTLARSPVLLLGLCLAGCAETEQPGYPKLWDSVDLEFQADLEQMLAGMHPEFMKTIKNEKLAIAVVDVTELQEPRVASVNGDVMLYAASLPKIAIVLGAFVEAESGDIELNSEVMGELNRMIRKSSNKDATAVLNRVGVEDLAAILQSPELELYDPEHNGGLWVGRPYSKGQAWKRDPIHHLSHGATAMQAARLYYLVITEQAVTHEHHQMMAEIFSKPAIKHKFVKGLSDKPDAEIARKSGTWRQFHADSGIVTRPDMEYIVVVLVDHEAGGEGIVDLIKAIDDLMLEQHKPAE
jgi:beta-lactamase class A